MDQLAERVSTTVRDEMTRLKLSQDTVAKHLGLSQAAVHRRLTGAVSWRLDELAALAGLLDIDAEQLVALKSAVAS